jgi:3-oxoacyl-[acyl-carrier protein] reductase
VDTSDLVSVKEFIKKHSNTDVLVLNTGGPPALAFDQITEEIWLKSFYQLFLSFILILQGIKVNPGGYVFLVSSFNIKEPDPDLILSNSLRVGFSSVMKSLSQLKMAEGVSFINIAPGPTDTDRLRSLLSREGLSVQEFSKTLPTGRVADAKEIGDFVRLVVGQKMRSLNGSTINFDMGLSRSLFG